jgi:hypothetical protein
MGRRIVTATGSAGCIGAIALALAGGAVGRANPGGEPAVVGVTDVATVWSGHPVGFALLTVKDRQYVAFYAPDRHLTVAARSVGETNWELFRLPSAQDGPPRGPGQTSAVVGWDSHNSIVMAADAEGRLHLAGNMHNNGLTYYRTESPGAIASFKQVAAMVGHDEERCTYPQFLTLGDGRLVFRYRTGESGNGDWILNVYDGPDRGWSRLLDRPLFDGEGQRNAYPLTPVRGPDGAHHVSWVWREAADCSTNHDLGYARSNDLVHWETADGRPLALPIRLASPGVVVDPVPVAGGLLNGTGQVGFDHAGRPVLAYHKYDADGLSQAYLARWRTGGWEIRRLSDWDYRWDFKGGGTLPRNEIMLGPVRPGRADELLLDFGHVKSGSGEWVIDDETLAVLRTERPRVTLPRGLRKRQGSAPDLQLRLAEDSGPRRPDGTRFVLRWETLPANRDRPRDPPWPEPSLLQVVEVRDPPEPGHGP